MSGCLFLSEQSITTQSPRQNENRRRDWSGRSLYHLEAELRNILALAARQLPTDWMAAYGVQPLLLETLVDRPYSGTCYRAANWIQVGQTQGRGRMDRAHQAQGSAKDILLYPLHPHCRQRLCQLPAPTLNHVLIGEVR